MPRRNARETNREEAVNVHLAESLKARGIAARAERRSREGIPDVRVDLIGGYQIILECKYEGATSLLESQLARRMASFPDAVGIVGMVYPSWMREERDIPDALISATDFEWWLYGSRSVVESTRRVRSGNVEDLADYLRVLPLELEAVDRVHAAAGVVGYALERSSESISTHARTERLFAEIISESDHEKDRSAAVMIAFLVMFNALAFHDRLASRNDEVPGIEESMEEDGLRGLRNAWLSICEEIDYVPVFELANEILKRWLWAPKPWHMPPLKPLIEVVELTRHLEGHDLSGRLFHTLLSDAKFTGAYYTSVPAATMLSRLVFDDWPAGVDWSDHEFPGSLNVADLACGTGTLLMAVASEVERKHLTAGGTDAAALHKAMVEQALHGYDVQLSAVHFAATSLAMLNPSIQFDRMNLYVMPLGVNGDQALLGSLEFLNTYEAAVQFALSDPDFGTTLRDAGRVFGSGTRGSTEGVTARLPDLDLAIMNPPFTRSVGGNLLFGSLPQPERRKLQIELSRRLKSMQASSTAGLGSAFVAAASPKLRPGEGRLALVLPLTVCTGPSWSQTRTLIENDYVLDVVVASHDPTRWNFSDSTDLSETLLIATRRPANGDCAEHRTTFVNLWQNPTGVLDAHLIADAVNTTEAARIEDTGTALLEVDGEHVGEVFSIPESKLKGKQWVGVQFARADVVRSALRLLEDGEVWIPGEAGIGSVPMCRLDEIGEIGPDVRDVRDGFEITDSATAYPMVENHDTNARKRMTTAPNKHLAPLVAARPNRRLKPLELLWPKAGKLLIAERLRLNTARVVTMTTETEVLSNVWWPIKTNNICWDKAVAVFMNSSIGLLSLLTIRNTTQGNWVKLKKVDLRALPTVDPRQLSPTQLQALSDLFDELADAEFERLPGMAQCPARTALDAGISEVLGLPDLDRLRVLLASEPVVCNEGL